MTQEEFDNYKFSIHTLIKFRGQWMHLTDVWFNDRKVKTKDPNYYLDYSEIEDIKQNQ